MILCAGQALIDCIVTETPAGGLAEDIALCPGGEAYNQAVTLKKLGDEAELLSAVGDDPGGSILKAGAAEVGLPIRTAGYRGRTPVSILTVDPTGNRKSLNSRVHLLEGFTPSIPEALTPDFVTFGSLFRPPFLNVENTLRFAREAKAKGARLIMDTKVPKGNTVSLGDYDEILSLSDYLTPNETEAAFYTGTTDPVRQAEIFRVHGARTVIVKLAERGCYVHGDEDRFFMPAFPIRCVDGIGAGDAFTAGLLHSLLKGAGLREAVRFASACGALTAAARGATAGIRDEAQVLSFLKEHGPAL